MTEERPTVDNPPSGAAFFAKTATPAEWRLVAAAIKSMEEAEATFWAGPAGLTFGAMDKDKFRLLAVDWPAKAFHKYACPKDTAVTVIVDQFEKAMARAGADDAVTVTTTGAGLLAIQFRGTVPKDFELHLTANRDRARMPTVELPTGLTLAPGTLEASLGDIAVVSDEFRLLVTKDLVRFTGDDEAAGNAKSELLRGNPDLLKFEPGPEATAIYSIAQVMPVLRALKGAQSIDLALGTNRPLRLRFKLNDAGASVTFWTTPRHVGAPNAGVEPPKAQAADGGEAGS